MENTAVEKESTWLEGKIQCKNEKPCLVTKTRNSHKSPFNSCKTPSDGDFFFYDEGLSQRFSIVRIYELPLAHKHGRGFILPEQWRRPRSEGRARVAGADQRVHTDRSRF